MPAFHFPESLPEGAILDGLYRIERLLGSGGMADVYVGDKLDLDIKVAIKVLKPIADERKRARFRERFLAEAQVAARIDHPNVVRILGYRGEMSLQLPDTGEETFERPFIVMELLVGTDLQAELTSGQLRPARAFELARGLLAGLAKGHQLGIVHKDLKPANLFVVPDRGPGAPEHIRVLDFGIARASDDDTSQTRTGESWCTPAYAAPEYIEDKAVSPALDVYQAGLVLTEMLSGRPLVNEETAFRCYAKHAAGLKLPQAIVDSPFGPVLSVALARNVADRYANAGAMLAALDAIDRDAIEAMTPLTASQHALELADDTVAQVDVATMETVDAGSPVPVTDRDAADAAKATPSGSTAGSTAASTPRWLPPLIAVALLALAIGIVLSVSSGGSEPSGESAKPGASEVEPSDQSTTAATRSSAIDESAAMACAEGETALGSICVPAGMVFIASGAIWFGCERDHAECEARQSPGAEVTVGAYFFDANEVTVGQYRACVEAGQCTPPQHADGQHYTWTMGDPERPVNGVTWDQANAYCTHVGGRLPTEIEWEGAARDVAGRRYPWGNQAITEVGPVANLAGRTAGETFGWPGIIVGYDDGHADPAPVTAFAADRRGIHNLAGNVREWVANCAHDGLMGDDPACTERLARGTYFGSFESPRLWNHFRGSGLKRGHARYDIGLRCAKSVSDGS